ncbi:deoxyribose-phosphate aldolase [Pseudoalteromonas rubra]|uniref:Deoxyribose-phosphate aldolase n=1 Tax=Pseudoalteromonas rubra TaxID=43658 RepID=A0A5S3URD0_9GAMM|nr:deoxyribose-phosphate aldolase [Pseudoalteromonas rubra]QPB81733.1 deoxyribose-phosphate aldolase [Pseudoalteromonas rubra]
MKMQAVAREVLGLMDLTSLNEQDNEASIIALLDSIRPELGLPAAVCVYPQFVALCKQELNRRGWTEVKVATVTNFPCGKHSLQQVLTQTREALQAGADEIDLVMPYQQLQAGDPDTPWQYVRSSKQLCGTQAKLKVIIESGALENTQQIAQASDVAILAGADFIKTSTGKVPVNATLEATRVMLERIHVSGKTVGFKAAGGVKSVEQASDYLQLAKEIMGDDWLTTEHFRFGASSLLQDVHRELDSAD